MRLEYRLLDTTSEWERRARRAAGTCEAAALPGRGLLRQGQSVYTFGSMLRSKKLFVGAMGFCLALSAGGMQALAAPDSVPTLDELTGSYKYVGDRARDEAAVKASSDTATAGMGKMTLKRALPRLQASTRIPESLSITLQGDQVTFKMDDHSVQVPKDGSSATAKTAFGETADVTFDAKTATLRQSVAKTGGIKTNTFRFNEAGRLVMQVRVTNDKLAAPVTFAPHYTK